MTAIPPGWYDDGRGSPRWWDGGRWTERVAAGEKAPGRAEAAVMVDGPPPEGSRLWIAWLALGLVIVAIVVGGAVLSSQLLGGTAIGVPAPSSSPSTDAGSGTGEGSRAPSVSAEERDAAITVVEAYSRAWQQSDCDVYLSTTSEYYRGLLELPDCESFYINSRGWVEGIDDYTFRVIDVERVGESLAVSTAETYTSAWDHDGNPLDAPTDFDDRFEYLLIDQDGEWVIHDGVWE